MLMYFDNHLSYIVIYFLSLEGNRCVWALKFFSMKPYTSFPCEENKVFIFDMYGSHF